MIVVWFRGSISAEFQQVLKYYIDTLSVNNSVIHLRNRGKNISPLPKNGFLVIFSLKENGRRSTM